MRELTAKVLASELDTHRYWLVDQVYHLPNTDADGWEIRLRLRGSKHLFLRLVDEPDRDLAQRLNEWGQVI